MNKRRESVTDHALALFLEKGISNTSVLDIIERAGISKGTFYNYYASKNECVGAILDQFYMETALSRSELLVGKNTQDIHLLIDQITLLIQLNAEHGMNTIYEEILYLGDDELRQLVLKYRLSEHEWLAERLTEVYGDELRPHAFEAAVLFFGMLHHLLFIHHLLHPSFRQLKVITASIFHYMEHIVTGLLHDDTAVLDHVHLTSLKHMLSKRQSDSADVISRLKELLDEEELSKDQQQLTEALLAEMKQKNVRFAVVRALLQSFIEAFKDAPMEKQSKQISTMIWFCLQQNKPQ